MINCSKYPGWKHKKLSAGVRNFILQYNWPGNIRELLKALKESGGNKSRVTELSGLPNYQTFSNWCKKYGLE